MSGTTPPSINALPGAISVPWETRDIVSLNDSLLAFSFIGDGLRDAPDPRMRR